MTAGFRELQVAKTLEPANELEPPPWMDDEPEPDESKPARERLRVWTPEEIWAPLAPPDFGVAGLFVRGALGLIVAPGSSLKTWMAVDLLLATATGSPWLGRFPCKVGSSLLIDWESGDYECRRRVHRLGHGREVTPPVQGLGLVSMPPFTMADDGFLVDFASLAATHAVIVLDSLTGGSGGADENDSRFAAVLYRLKAIATASGCIVIVLHHAKKSPTNGAAVDQQELVRGSSAIFNAVDVVLQLSRAEDGAFKVTQTKARSGKAVEPFMVRVDDLSDAASTITASNVPDGEASELEAVSRPLDKAKRAVITLLARQHDLRSKNEICNRTGGTKSITLKAIAELEERKTIGQVDGTFRLLSEVRK